MTEPRDDASGGQNTDAVDDILERSTLTPHEAAPQEDVHADSLTLALQTLGTNPESPHDAGLVGDNEVLAAIQGTDAAAGIEHALDQLTHATDLFDISVVDFGSESAES